MGAFGVFIRILQYAGLCVQLNAALDVARGELDNHITADALFLEVPHDITTQSGEDVEMACSFRGTGSPSYSLEIQWWYIRDHRDWKAEPAQLSNAVIPLDEASNDATKISVVKVAGSNISHRLRLSSVRPSDEGTYECRVIDLSGALAQHHRVRAYLQVTPESSKWLEDAQQTQEPGGRLPESLRHGTQGEEVRRRSAGSTACNGSCGL